jgi:hypothetical protein
MIVMQSRQAAQFPSRTNAQAVIRSAPHGSPFIVATFFGVIFLTIAATSWKIAGVPLHSFFSATFLVVIAITHRPQTVRAFRLHGHLLNLTIAIALLGTLVSAWNGVTAPQLLNELVEIHLQSIVLLLLGAIVSEVCGSRTVLLCLLTAILLSAAFAVLQFAGLGFPWTIREAIIEIAGKDPARRSAIRPPGLSFSKIALGTQMCLAFAAYYIYRTRSNTILGRQTRHDMRVPIAVAAFAVICMASGNRSPIIGGAIFYCCYLARRKPHLAVAAALLALLCAPLLGDLVKLLNGTGLRAFAIGDKSSEGRETLLYYGFRLFLENPLGYGLGFDPRMYWSDHWAAVQSMPNAVAVREEELHSYFMNMLDYYGVAILLLVPYALHLMRRQSAALLGFVPYIIHITFHNYGPFQNDTLIMYVIAATVGPFLAGGPAATAQRPVAGLGWQRPWYVRVVRSKPTPSAAPEVAGP